LKLNLAKLFGPPVEVAEVLSSGRFEVCGNEVYEWCKVWEEIGRQGEIWVDEDGQTPWHLNLENHTDLEEIRASADLSRLHWSAAVLPWEI
jgi:hypothetical protein